MRPLNPRNPFDRRTLIIRLSLGTGLIALGIWGFFYCHRLMSSFLPTEDYTTDRSFGWMGAWSSWFVIFFPVFLAGVWLVYSTLRRVDLEDFVQRPFGGSRPSGRGPDGVYEAEVLDPVGGKASGSQGRRIEAVSDAEAERLLSGVDRTLKILRVVTGGFLVCAGAFFLIYFLFIAPSYENKYVGALTARVYFRFALLAALSVLVGLGLLLDAFRRKDTSWLIPLRIFNRVVMLRLRVGGKRTGGSGNPSQTKR